MNPWPGYVDALSTLLMVIIFVLLVFVLAQAFLSVAVSGRDRALDRLNRQVAELTETLSLERGRAGEIQLSAAALSRELQAANAARDQLARDLAALRDEHSRLAAERDALRAERDRLAARLADAELQAQSSLARNEQLQARVGEASAHADAAGQETAAVAGQLAEARRQLTQTRAARDAVQAELDRTVEADRATIAARVADLARLTDELRALLAVRQQLEQQAQQQQARAAADEQRRQALVAELTRTQTARDAVMAELSRTAEANRTTAAARTAQIAGLADAMRALSASRDALQQQSRQQEARASAAEQQSRQQEARAAAAEQQSRQQEARASAAEQQGQRLTAQLADERRLGEAASAQIAQLNSQVASLTKQLTGLRAQLHQVAAALDVAEQVGRNKDAQIADLGTRLNAALLSKVEELQHYRSEFFGRLRDVLQNRQGVQIVGDRFVFQSEVLFPVGSAELIPSGQEQIRKIAITLKQIMAEMPADVPWVLRVDGHADRQPVGNSLFASNWELSAQRAINVVKLLIQEGIPPNRLAASGFGEFQPLEGAETPAAYARNRRIELRLTDR